MSPFSRETPRFPKIPSQSTSGNKFSPPLELTLRKTSEFSFIPPRKIGGPAPENPKTCQPESPEALTARFFTILDKICYCMKIRSTKMNNVTQIATADAFWKSPTPFSCNIKSRLTARLPNCPKKTSTSAAAWNEWLPQPTMNLTSLNPICFGEQFKYWIKIIKIIKTTLGPIGLLPTTSKPRF